MAEKKVTIPLQAPYDSKGNLLQQANSYMPVSNWVDNDPFTMSLQFKGIGNTYSNSSLAYLITPDGRGMHMYGVEFNKIASTLTLKDGWTEELTWQVRKHSNTSYGLMLV